MKVLEEYKTFFYKRHWRYSIEFSDEREMIDALNRCYDVPAEIRHQKLYENRRYDLMARPYWKVGKIPPHSFVEAELNFFGECNEDLLRWQYHNLNECLRYVKDHCSEESIYYKGLNAIRENPYLGSDLVTLHFVLESKEVAQIDKNIPRFVEMLLS